jgi:glycosyltransferase involved in cell wall biosynthesis
LEKLTLDIIVPGYNPLPKWDKQFLYQASLIIERLPEFQVHFYLINDGSDENWEEGQAALLQKELEHLHFLDLSTNKGKGFAVRAGLQLSKSEFIAFTDIDFPYTVQCFLDMLNKIQHDEFDIMVGHRREAYYKKISPGRRWMSSGLRRLIRWSYRLPVDDTQSGLKVFNSKGKEMLLQTSINRYLFDMEFIQIASRAGLRIGSIPLELRQGIVLPPIPLWLLVKEFRNLVKLLLRI